MATIADAQGASTPNRLAASDNDDNTMSTLPDPRSRALSPAQDHSPSSPRHPDLSNEVATLSNKLINAINHQTNLDDTLSATRHELEAARDRIMQLEMENQEHTDLIARGILVRRSIADTERNKIASALADERRQRAEIEKEKKNIEQELENLTTALFEEANKVRIFTSPANRLLTMQMVITSREEAQKEHDIVQRRNDQLKAQLADTESLLKSHQEQLTELKQVMEQMTEMRDDQTNPTTPSTPGANRFEARDQRTPDGEAAQSTTLPDLVVPTYPTSFTHLLQTVLRTDLTAYDEFASLLRMSKTSVSSRVSSGSYGSMGLGLSLGAHNSGASQQLQGNGSSFSLSTAGAFGSTPGTPITPASASSTGSTNGSSSLHPLKETKFYKRALAEDVEPTLRLDAAPGLSWLARRTVLNAVCEGTLVVEPMPTPTKLFFFPCSLCGESRKDPTHVRSHRFKTNENENAQRYPLCNYCLGRVRSTCNFLGFLRMVKDGHWRADGQEPERAAWEESAKLREQMFWCRVGGGVVPAIPHGQGDASRSHLVGEYERREQEKKLGAELGRTCEIQPPDITPMAEQPSTLTPNPTNNIELDLATNDTCPSEAVQEHVRGVQNDEIDTESHRFNRDSTPSMYSVQDESSEEGLKRESQRLSITIPDHPE